MHKLNVSFLIDEAGTQKIVSAEKICDYIISISDSKMNQGYLLNQIKKGTPSGKYGLSLVRPKEVRIHAPHEVEISKDWDLSLGFKSIVVDSSNYVLDGRHRVLQAIRFNVPTMEAWIPISSTG